MTTFDRQGRIKQLKTAAKRKELANQLVKLLSVDTIDFLSVEETISFAKKVYENCDNVSGRSQIDKEYKLNYEALTNLKNRMRDYFEFQIVILHPQDRETGAVIIQFKHFMNNLNVTHLPLVEKCKKMR